MPHNTTYMGEFADEAEDRFWSHYQEEDDDNEYSADDIIQSYENGTFIWTMQTGVKIAVDIMTISHLKNCIRFIKRRTNDTLPLQTQLIHAALIIVFKAELWKRAHAQA